MPRPASDADQPKRADGPPVGEYDPRPVYRRLAYAAISVPMLVAIMLIAASSQDDCAAGGGVVIPSIVFGLLGIGWLWLFAEAIDAAFSRFRVDEQGIHKIGWPRRHCFWPWDVFRSGKVQDRYDIYGLHFPERPRACRYLPIGALATEDADRLKTYIDHIRPPRRLRNPPDEVSFHSQGSGWRFVTMTSDGITLKRMKWEEDEVFGWDDVVDARLLRAEAGRLDFREMRLRLSGHEIVVRCTSEDFNRKVDELWRIAHVLGRNIAPETLKDFSLSGEPRSIEEFDVRYERSIPDKIASPRTVWITAWIAFGIWIALSAYMLAMQFRNGTLPLYLVMDGLLIITFALVTVVPTFGLYFLSVADDKRRTRREHEYQQRRQEVMTRLPLEHSF